MTLFDFQTSESHLAGETVRYRRWSQSTFKVDSVPPSRWMRSTFKVDSVRHQGGCDPPSRSIPFHINAVTNHLEGRSRLISMRSRLTLKVDPVRHVFGHGRP